LRAPLADGYPAARFLPLPREVAVTLREASWREVVSTWSAGAAPRSVVRAAGERLLAAPSGRAVAPVLRLAAVLAGRAPLVVEAVGSEVWSSAMHRAVGTRFEHADLVGELGSPLQEAQRRRLLRSCLREPLLWVRTAQDVREVPPGPLRAAIVARGGGDLERLREEAGRSWRIAHRGTRIPPMAGRARGHRAGRWELRLPETVDDLRDCGAGMGSCLGYAYPRRVAAGEVSLVGVWDRDAGRSSTAAPDLLAELTWEGRLLSLLGHANARPGGRRR
jgi:hypothetical protein